jgi:3-oxoacyl-[acyl-carrier protein] reductase
LMRQLAVELAERGIRANSVCPGFIDAGMSTPIYADAKVRKARSGAVPVGRLGTADDVANAVAFLDSEAGSYVNGHELVIDGGVTHTLLKHLPRE